MVSLLKVAWMALISPQTHIAVSGAVTSSQECLSVMHAHRHSKDKPLLTQLLIC